MTSQRPDEHTKRRLPRWWLVGAFALVLVIVLIGGIVHLSSKGGDSTSGASPTASSGSSSAGSGSPTSTDRQVMPGKSRVDLDAGSQELVHRTAWSKVVTDDFTGSSLNQKNWNYYYPWGARTNEANGEHQWYQSSNVAVADQRLTITAKRESKGVERVTDSGKRAKFPYTSGLITTAGKVQADVGGVDVRAKSPVGAELWPAIWLLPAKGYPPEFDVFETYGQSPTIHQTAHFADDKKTNVLLDDVDPSDGFHTYSARWDRDRVVYMVDGTVTLAVPRGDASSPLYLLLNLAVGSKFLGAPSGQTPASAAFQVDSVVFMVGDA